MIAQCASCPWTGVPTRVGGRKTGAMRHYRAGTAFEVSDSQVQAACPACKGPLR